jgi:hypothetical protein
MSHEHLELGSALGTNAIAAIAGGRPHEPQRQHRSRGDRRCEGPQPSRRCGPRTAAELDPARDRRRRGSHELAALSLERRESRVAARARREMVARGASSAHGELVAEQLVEAEVG